MNFKRLSLVLIMCLLLGIVAVGCAKTGKCDDCGEIDTLYAFEYSSGETEYLCESCYEIAEIAQKFVDELEGGFRVLDMEMNPMR